MLKLPIVTNFYIIIYKFWCHRLNLDKTHPKSSVGRLRFTALYICLVVPCSQNCSAYLGQ